MTGVPPPKRLRKGPAANIIAKGGSVLDADFSTGDSAVYHPQSQVTAGVYKEILSLLQTVLFAESSEVLYDAAHECIGLLRSDVSDTMKHSKVREMLPGLTEELYSSLMRLSRLVTDYDSESTSGVSRLHEGGIAVTFDEGDEVVESLDGDDYSSDDEVQQKQESEFEKIGKKVLQDSFTSFPTEEELPSSMTGDSLRAPLVPKDPIYVSWEDIRGDQSFWLRKELGKIETSEETIVSLEQSIKSVLDSEDLFNTTALENKLVSLFRFRHFDFCKKLVSNRFKIWAAERFSDFDEKFERIKKLGSDKKAVEFVSEYLKTTEERTPQVNNSGLTNTEYPLPSELLDLSQIVFNEGGRLMSNPAYVPKTKTFQTTQKNYEEVHVSPMEKAVVPSSELVRIKIALPEWAQAAFAGLETLNPVQSRVFPIAFGEFDENMMICAPTGAGKTNIAMLTIMNVLGKYMGSMGSSTSFKVVYIAPMKALVQEVVKSFSIRLNPLGLKVAELSGDANLSRAQMQETSVIVTTPEKWDVVTRKSGESFARLVRLIIIDEIHLLHDSRGPVLEAIVARTIRESERSRERVRLVGLSATLPNYADVARFLRVTERGLFFFGSEYRPVPLEQTYVGITVKKAMKKALVVNEVVYEKVVEEVRGGKRMDETSEGLGQSVAPSAAPSAAQQVLIFVHGRKETWRTAKELLRLAGERNELGVISPPDSSSKGVLVHEAGQVKNAQLKELLPSGILIHHAGLAAADRAAVEDLFAARHALICVATLTLAWGVNLPAHTVIIKGTQIYQPEKGAWCELSPMDMMQMIGRAGRPQYDSTGHGIVITNKSELGYYLSLNNMQLPIESQMVSVLADMVNAEVALGSIVSRESTAKWIQYTYLYVRMQKNPGLYGLSVDVLRKDPELVQRRVDLAHAALTKLHTAGLVKYDFAAPGGPVQSTSLGRVASYFYLKVDSVGVYVEHLKPSLTDLELLRIFSLSKEFQYIPLRDEEKVELSKLVELVPVPVKGGAESANSKINVLLQSYVSRLTLDGFALLADMVYVTQNAGRLFRALFEIALKRNWSALARKCLLWSKIVELRMWPVQTCLRHFRSVPEEVCKKIERKSLSNDEIRLLSEEELGELIRMPKLTSAVFGLLQQIPRINVTAYVQPVTRSLLHFRVEILVEHTIDPTVHGETEYYWLFVEEVSQQFALYSDQVGVRTYQVAKKLPIVLSFTVPVTDPVPPFYFVRVVSDKWMGVETVRAVSLGKVVLPAKMVAAPIEMELLDKGLTGAFDRLDDAIKSLLAQIAVMSKGASLLPQIESLLLDPILQSRENLLICLPEKSGIDSLIGLALTAARSAVVLVVSASQQDRVFRQWSSIPSLSVHRLTGDPFDLKILESVGSSPQSSLIISSGFQWDLVTRKWRTKRVKRILSDLIGTVVVTDLQSIDSTIDGPLMELVVSRMRYIASEKISVPRIIGVSSACILNAAEMANWLGAKKSACFNFAPSCRSTPLEVYINGSDVYNRTARQQAMMRPLFANIGSRCSGSQILIVTCDRKHTRQTATELCLMAAAENRPDMFLLTSNSERVHQVVREEALAVSLSHGVGYLHGGLSFGEKRTVVDLFTKGDIRIVVGEMDYIVKECGLKAESVIVLDTSVYSTAEMQYVDYSLSDMLAIIACANAKNLSRVILFCAQTKREYYKKFINEPIPAESGLDAGLSNYLNAEIANGTIKSRQDCIDWLTWTFFYRRLTSNPNYYSLAGASNQELSDFLSTLVEASLDSLVQAGMISDLAGNMTDENTTAESPESISPSDLGLIAAYYCVDVASVELFKRTVDSSFKRKQLIDLIARASEFTTLINLLPDEFDVLQQLSNILGLGVGFSEDIESIHSKVLVLLYSHFNRIPLTQDLHADLAKILPFAHRLTLCLVDVISTSGWLKVVLAAMEIAPMIVQGVLASMSPLMQLPYFDQEICDAASGKYSIEDVFDLLAAEEQVRNELLSNLSPEAVGEIARACNLYPSVTLSCGKSFEDECMVIVTLEREGEVLLDKGTSSFIPVSAPLYPKTKDEGWWVVAGTADGEIADLKRVTVTKQTEKVSLSVPAEMREMKLKVYLMSDAWVGCDQEEEL